MNISERRTIRKYSDREVSDTLLEELLSKAARAATMGNMQLYSVIITKDQALKQALAPLHFNQPMVTEANAVLTFCADFHRFTRWCQLRNADAGYDNMLSFINASIDTILLTQAFCTLAEEKGLGTCFLGTTVYQPLGIIETLHLPPLTFPVATITVGWPAEIPNQTDRLPLEAFVHEETYHDYATDTLNRLYAYKEALPENRHLVEINHKQNLAQVFTDCRYTRKDNETLSEGLLTALHQQGFLPKL